MTAPTGTTGPVLARRVMKARRAGGRCPACRDVFRIGEWIALPAGTRVRWLHRDCLIKAREAK